MRVILSRYSALPPNELRFIAGQYGKPALAQQPGLWFNLSHSRDLALLAVTRAAPVGIDVEDRQREVEVPQLAQRIFSATEMAGFMACHEGGRRTLFFDLWTRKEAVLKASGKGLSMPLDAFDVSTEPDAGWHEVSVRAATPGDEQYLLCALHIAGEYAGAVALQRAASVAEAPPGLRYQDY